MSDRRMVGTQLAGMCGSCDACRVHPTSTGKAFRGVCGAVVLWYSRPLSGDGCPVLRMDAVSRSAQALGAPIVTEELANTVFKRILFVCVGNICRSPTAEYLLRARLASDEFDVASAGLSAVVGQPIDKTAAQLLLRHGVDGSAHVGRQLTGELLRRSDLILTMEKSQAAAIIRKAPEVSGRVFLLGKWQSELEIPDPYRQPRSAFDHAYRLIENGVMGWLPHIS